MIWLSVALGLTVFGLCLWLRNTPYPSDADESSWGVQSFKKRTET